MALQCNMIKDIRKYEPKVMGPFTKRQMIYLVIGLAYSLPVGMLLPTTFDNKVIVTLALIAPMFLCGYLKMDGTPLEVIAIRWVYRTILTPAARKYKRPHPYLTALRKLEAEENKGKKPVKVKPNKNPEFKVYK